MIMMIQIFVIILLLFTRFGLFYRMLMKCVAEKNIFHFAEYAAVYDLYLGYFEQEEIVV